VITDIDEQGAMNAMLNRSRPPTRAGDQAAENDEGQGGGPTRGTMVCPQMRTSVETLRMMRVLKTDQSVRRALRRKGSRLQRGEEFRRGPDEARDGQRRRLPSGRGG